VNFSVLRRGGLAAALAVSAGAVALAAIVAVVGVMPVGATSAPMKALTNDDLPLENSPMTVTSSG